MPSPLTDRKDAARRGSAKKAKASALRTSRAKQTHRESPVASPKPLPEQSSPLGRKMIAGLEGLISAMKTGGLKEVGRKLTVHRVKKAHFEKPLLSKAEVAAIRRSLEASQTVFAGLLGVSVGTVQAWEQGVNTPSGIALRFLSELRAKPDYWRARLKEAAAS